MRAYSPIEEFTKGNFQELIDDATISAANKVKKVVVCSGKIYFDLSEYQMANHIQEVALVRLEQIHPFPAKQMDALKAKYKNASFVWAQEEPRNMGALSFLMLNTNALFTNYIARPASAATATGYSKQHAKEQQTIIDAVFTI